MQLKRLLVLSVAFSVLASCGGKGPKVTVCLLDPERQELQCSDADGNESVVLVSQATNYVCLSPTDAQKVVDYAKASCK